MTRTSANRDRLGLDIGAVAVKAVRMAPDGAILQTDYQRHHGHPARALQALARHRAWPADLAVGLTGALAGPAADRLCLTVLDQVAALRAAVGRLHPGAPVVIDVGGGSLSLVELGPGGEFRSLRSNSVCAAGTGSFLDEQAERLGLSEEALASMPEIASPPSIAARCSVFAKSDLIHRQQEGYGKAEVWSGLARGLAQTILQTLLRGRRLPDGALLAGGVALNRELVRWLAIESGARLTVPPRPELTGALGAALLAPARADSGDASAEELDWEALALESSDRCAAALRPPLVLTRSRYPDFAVAEEWLEPDGTEVRLTAWPASGAEVVAAIGIDVGSTSTKAVLIDPEERVLLDVYRKTAGDPIEATRRLLAAVSRLSRVRRTPVRFLAAGTTGSGRKLVGAVTGADLVVNEITAHLTGATQLDPTIDTIFEIGGQDAKFIRTRHGRLHESNMNFVCAAGTGSFVEEQARKLGFEVAEVGAAVAGIAPPITADRCTVFMEQDVHRLLREGYSRPEVMAAVLYSVIKNYLTKVVGNRGYSRERVFFQGATARNRGLVAALENLLGVEVVVSPYCHQMGALGAALAALRELPKRAGPTRFAGLEFASRAVALRQERCELCTNRCAITFADVEGLAPSPSWGYLCGRDPEETKVRRPAEFRHFRVRDRIEREAAGAAPAASAAAAGPAVGLPRALAGVGLEPLWRAFVTALGARPVSSGRTDRELADLSSDWVGGDYCFPVKLAHGHARKLLEDPAVDWVLAPHMVAAPNPDRKTTETYFCPYNIGLPSMVRAALATAGARSERLLTPVVDMRLPPAEVARDLHRALGGPLAVSRGQVEAAWKAGLAALEGYRARCREAGRQALSELAASGRQAVVILGRPYNVFDEGANLALPSKLARLGIEVLPMDFLPLAETDLPAGYENMYWDYGRKILEAAQFVASQPQLAAAYLSNFSCGPDSFLVTYVEEILGDKPLLVLELDEHGADAGYLTRLEAFSDVLRAARPSVTPARPLRFPPADRRSLAGRTLWVPPMHPFASPLAAAALRGSGFAARALPRTTPEAFDLGRSLCRGSECVPAPATLGSFVQVVQEEGGDPARHALLMATASGPCRFGQYRTLDRVLLDRVGWSEVPIVSWTSIDSYRGIDAASRRWTYRGIVAGDVLFRLGTRVRPYELTPGATDALLAEGLARLEAALQMRRPPEPEIRRLAEALAALPRSGDPRPLVGIVGEIYVRCDPFANSRLVEAIERAGGEAWLAPATEWFLYTAHCEHRHRAATILARLGRKLQNRVLFQEQRRLFAAGAAVLADRPEPPIESTVAAGARYVPEEFEGETILTIGRAVEFIHQGARLVVNCSPFGCMPGAITSGIFQQVIEELGVPVLSQFYDGESALNEQVATYLANLEGAGRPAPPPRTQPGLRGQGTYVTC